MTFETEFTAWDAGGEPLHAQPAYGIEATRAAGAYLLALVRRLRALGVPVDQVHPGVLAGQLEVSVGVAGPVAAADRVVLVRDVIRTVARELGLRVSLSAKPSPDVLGNGAHLHLSLWRGGANLFGTGDDGYGMTPRRAASWPGYWRSCPPFRRRVREPGVVPPPRPQPLDGCLRLLGRREPRGAAAADPGPSRKPPGRRKRRAEGRRRVRQPVPGGRRRDRGRPARIDAGLELPAEVTIDPATMDDADRAAAGIAPLPATLGCAAAAVGPPTCSARRWGRRLPRHARGDGLAHDDGRRARRPRL